jgi:hypothetical protein
MREAAVATASTIESGERVRLARVRRFAPAPPAVHGDRILRIQRYSDLTRVRPVIRRAADAMARHAESLSDPAVAYVRAPIAALDEEALAIGEGPRFHCRAFATQLRGCTEIAAFVLTVGPALPERVVELVEAGDLLEGLLLETAGWLAIEDATRQFKVHLRAEMQALGRRITSRMGPGYSYRIGGSMHAWPLQEQGALFGLFEGADLPVSLMHSCAMVPKMSRSGLYGVASATLQSQEPR